MGDADKWTRPPPRGPNPDFQRVEVPFGPFYGYPAEIVARWCGVGLDTAQAYKTGRRQPSRAVMRLFALHRDMRVMTPAWNGWLIKPDSIVDPDGNETSRSQLHNYFWVVQFARQMAADQGEETHSEFYKLLSR